MYDDGTYIELEKQNGGKKPSVKTESKAEVSAPQAVAVPAAAAAASVTAPAVDDFHASEGPSDSFVMGHDSHGHGFMASKELVNDIEVFQRMYGRAALDVTVFEEDVTLLIELGIDKVIGRDMMLAWGFDRRKRVYARLKTNVYYRDRAVQKLTVQQGGKADEEFTPKFQLEHIINTFVTQTWSHSSKPFINPVTKTVYKSHAIGRSAGPRCAVGDNLRKLVEMGFNIGKATRALQLSEGDISTAATLCCAYDDILDTSDLDPEELDRQLAIILSGKDACSEEGCPDDKAFPRSYLVDIVQYIQSRVPSLNEYCIICDQKHLFGHMLKPTVCNRELCCWAFQELGVASGATDFVAVSHEVINMLLTFAKEAVSSSRCDKIFDPYPLVFDPADRTKKVIDPDRKDYATVSSLLSRIPTMKSVVSASSSPSVVSVLSRVSPYAYPLLNWIITSNRSFFVKVPDTLRISELNADQFLMLSSPPEKEKVFRSLRKQYGSVYAFHGSSLENWHSIVRNGLRNASGTSLQVNGAAYGSGIYMSPFISTAAHYTRGSGSGLTVVAVVEVINNRINKATSQVWTMPEESYVTTRMLLMFHGVDARSNPTTGDMIAPKIRSIMTKFGVSQD